MNFSYMDKQHLQLPNNMAEFDLVPQDMLIYISIKRYMNNKTRLAYPSLQKIKEVSGASINTIRSSIKRLEDKEFIKVIKEGKGNKYLFNSYKNFEPFSYDFLDKTDLSFTEKSYILASQQHMYKDVEGIGKVSYTNRELSSKINMPESTISKANRSLQRKNYLRIIKNNSRDLETGCKTDTKLFDLNLLGQAVIWAIKDHEERITKNTDDILELKREIELLKKQNEASQKTIQSLKQSQIAEPATYTM